MSIELYVGAVGSGKSYHALRRALGKCNALRNNTVISNFPIKAKTRREKENWIYMEEFEPQDLIKLSFERGCFGREGSALILIDEAGVWFNSRDWQIDGNKRKEWVKFFSQSRKFGYDIVLVAQDVRMLDRQIRSMAEYHVKHVMLRNYTWLKWLPWKIFGYVSYWQGGSFRGSVQLDILLPWVAKKYDSMRLFKMSDEVLALAETYGIDVRQQKEELEIQNDCEAAQDGASEEGEGFPLGDTDCA